MDHDDPADWPIDRVIQEICHTTEPIWAAGTDLKPILNPETVSKAFRDNDIDGDNLLALEDMDIKSDLGITSFGQRRALRNIIDHLRSLSTKYRARISIMNRPVLATPQLSHLSLVSHGRSPSYADSAIQASVENYKNEGFVINKNFQDRAASSNAFNSHKRKYEDPSSPIQRLFGDPAIKPSGGYSESAYIAADPMRVVHRLTPDARMTGVECASFHIPAQKTSDHHDKPPAHISNQSNSTTQQRNNTERPNENQTAANEDGAASSSPQIQQKKPPKRGTLIPVTSRMLSETQLGIIDSINNDTHVRELVNKQPPSSTNELKVAFSPAKRVKLTEIITVDQSSSLHDAPNRQHTSKIRHKHLRPDQVVSEESGHPKWTDVSEDDSDVEFSFVSSVKSGGRMHRGIQLVHNNPLKHDAFSKVSENHSTSSNFDPAAGFRSAMKNPSPDLPSELLELLQKYPINEDDIVLPLYGDSDEEDRLWTPEMETPPPENSNMNDKLSQKEIDIIIDECLEGFRADWQVRSLSKVQARAHAKWMAAAKNPSMHRRMLEECENWQARVNYRIQQLRKGIHFSEWRKADDVKQQCLAMETSVQQLQEYCFYITVLECVKEPICPPRATTNQSKTSHSRTFLPNGDEELHSDSEDSFVVVDDEEAFRDGTGASHDQESPKWTPQFAEKSIVHAQKQNLDQTVQHLSQDEVIDSIEDTRNISTSEKCTDKHDGFSDYRDIMDIVPLPSTPASKKHQKLADHKKVQESAARNPMLIPALIETDEDGSDLDRAPRLPATKHRKQGFSLETAIDLTLLSSPSRSEKANSVGIHTPNHHANAKLPFGNRHLSGRHRISSSEMRLTPRSNIRTNRDQRPLYNVKRISQMNWDDLEPANGDQPVNVRLALAKSVYEMEKYHSNKLLDYIQSFRDDFDMKEILQNGLSAALNEDEQIDDVEQKNQQNAWNLTNLFVSYATGYRSDAEEGWSEDQVNDAHGLLEDGLSDFRYWLPKLLQRYAEYTDTGSSLDRASADDISADADNDTDNPISIVNTNSPFKNRKRKVVQSKDVLDQQHRDQQRANEQEAQRARILKKKSERGIEQDKLSVSINIKEPLVYLDPRIAQDVKPHQIEGIRFMWREIIENPNAQGCLLAHTMGLGKTMQVVSLLSLIAQSNSSEDPAIRDYIPQHLKRLKILVLCPVALIENWYEEFMRWLPDPMMLGVIIKLDKDVKKPEVTLKGWSKKGGVLIIGYERFRRLVKMPNKSTNGVEEPTEQRRILIEEPSVVIADEAHKLKNVSSGVNQAAHQLITKSRIAMTGSPLNNHLEEYHTMIDWISPRYLGSMVQFKSKYVEPIGRGLYSESTSWERKTSMKKLHVLKKIIAPKINRADITAISKDLPPKTEFFLTITLTGKQKEAYQMCVAAMRASTIQGSGLQNARVWSWLGVLSLLLNHPSCFIRKLKERNEPRAKILSHRSRTESDDYSHDSDAFSATSEHVDVTKVPLSSNTMEKVFDVFAETELPTRIHDPTLSNKSHLIKLILDEAVRLQEKTLIFSKSIPTLNYYEAMIRGMGLGYKRIDGTVSTVAGGRQRDVAEFNESNALQVFLISTRAGGLGLNIQSATRVIINDFDFNPTWEEQAVGRAYRIGQVRPVFVYRFLVGGTFEEKIHNKAVFKTQLFSRVVDEKNVISQAAKSPGEFLVDPVDVPQRSFDDCLGKDPHVLDRILPKVDFVRNIFLTETFFQDDDEELNEQELKEADEELELEQLERDDPSEYARRLQAKKLMRQPFMPAPMAGMMSTAQEPFTGNTSQSYPHFLDLNIQPRANIRPIAGVQNALPGVHDYAHEQYAARRSFGDEFVGQKRMSNLLRDDHATPQNASPALPPSLPKRFTDDKMRSSPYFLSFRHGHPVQPPQRPMPAPVTSVSNVENLNADQASMVQRPLQNNPADSQSVPMAQNDNADAEQVDQDSRLASGCRTQ